MLAPQVLPDADDTSKAILTLSLLGEQVSSEHMVSYFEMKEGHFKTYVGERNPSFSANCNVLMALLHNSELDKYLPQIESITRYLCQSWLSGTMTDKWVSNHE